MEQNKDKLKRNRRRERTGTVSSDKMEKSIVVIVKTENQASIVW